MSMSPEGFALNINEVVGSNLCIGCGLCSAVCSESAISVAWQKRRIWQPSIADSLCTNCGRCLRVCPHSPQCIGEYAAAAQAQGVRFGLPQDSDYFIAYDKDENKRIRSASGGVTSALLGQFLDSGAVDGVLASLPLEGEIGEPHFQMQIFRSAKELDRGRSSHYHPLCYDKVLNELRVSEGSFALVGVPCVLRGVVRLPSELQEKIKFKVCLVCSHNVTGAFSDCLACKEGVGKGVSWGVDLRDKVGIPDANNFNNLFNLPDREIRRNRFITAFTDMWRNYFFAQECCLYCSDFYGIDSDISIKDAWGRLSGDPLGVSLVMVSNGEIKDHLERLKEVGRLVLDECSSDEIFNSQTATPIFKHVKVRDRLVWKKNLKQVLDKNHPSLGWRRRWLSRDSHEYWRLWSLIKLSEFFFFRFGKVPVKSLLVLFSPLKGAKMLQGNVFSRTKGLAVWPWSAILSPILRACARFVGYRRAERGVNKDRLRVLVAGGYGYGNVGDEAQLAANIQHWRKAEPGCRLTILTPNIQYTEAIHGPIRTELAPRVSLFGRGQREYYGSDKAFKRKYFFVSGLCLLNACLIRAGLPAFGLRARQVRLLDELNNSDVLFLSGGGYLTGMTLTRLWDNMLLLRLAYVFGVPTVLSGQTIGVFHDPISRALAKWGLMHAGLIYLRDHTDSPRDLAAIGIPENKINCTFDDALFFDPASAEKVRLSLQPCGIDPEIPYVAVNCHFWGQTPAVAGTVVSEFAKVLDRVIETHGLQVVFVPMCHSDEEAMREVMKNMKRPAFLPEHGYQPALAVGLIQNASLCLTLKHHPIVFAMAASVPVVSVVFDDYYWHKNLGAMSIFNQGDYLIDGRESENLSGSIEEKINSVLMEKGKIEKNIGDVVSGLEVRAGEAVYLWSRKMSHDYARQ